MEQTEADGVRLRQRREYRVFSDAQLLVRLGEIERADAEITWGKGGDVWTRGRHDEMVVVREILVERGLLDKVEQDWP